MAQLIPGDRFPDLRLPSLGGGTLTLPQSVAGHYGTVLIYRGAWCPYCNAQLSAFQRAHDRLEAADVKVVALSVDDATATAALAEKHGLAFPIGYSADARQIAEATGAFVSGDPRPVYLESTGFVLDPEGRVVVSVYSTRAIGRLVPDDVIGVVNYVRRQTPA